MFFILLWLWHLIFTLVGLYGSKRLASRRAEAMDVAKATSLCALVLLVASWLLRFRMVTPSFVLVFWTLSTFLAVSSRIAVRTYQRRLRIHGRDSRNMLIVGSNRRAIEFAQFIQSKPELGYRIIGFADDEWTGIEELQKHGWSLVCSLKDLRSHLRRNVVDEVILAIPLRSFHDHASDIAAMCEQQGIILRMLSDMFNLRNGKSMVEGAEESLITHYGAVEEGWPPLIKRMLDFTLSLLLLIAVAPYLFPSCC